MYGPLPNGKLDCQAVYRLIDEINEEIGKEEVPLHESGDSPVVKICLEMVVASLLDDFLIEKKVKTDFKCIVYSDGVEIYKIASKFKPTPENLSAVNKTTWWKPRNVLLNELDIKDAVEVYIDPSKAENYAVGSAGPSMES